MQIIKTVTTVFDILYAIAIISFLHPLKWQNKNDRFSIVAFIGMVVIYALNILCMQEF